MVDPTTHAPVLHPPTAGRLRRRPSVPAAPDGPHVGGPWLGHCPPLRGRRPAFTGPARSRDVGRGINHLRSAAMELLERVAAGGLLEPGAPVLVLLSGGRDSVCL